MIFPKSLVSVETPRRRDLRTHTDEEARHASDGLGQTEEDVLEHGDGARDEVDAGREGVLQAMEDLREDPGDETHGGGDEVADRGEDGRHGGRYRW